MEAKKKIKIKEGRPTTYTPLIAQEICDTMRATDIPLSDHCKNNAHWPAYSTVYLWFNDHPDFSDAYYTAIDQRNDYWLESQVRIADFDANDMYINSKGESVPNMAALARAKMRMDARRWVIQMTSTHYYKRKLANIKQEEAKEDANNISKLIGILHEQHGAGSKTTTPSDTED